MRFAVERYDEPADLAGNTARALQSICDSAALAALIFTGKTARPQSDPN